MSSSDEHTLRAIGDTFRAESAERIAAINRLLLMLERGEARDPDACLDAIAREAHTLKGGASILGLELIAETAHAMEEAFEALRDAHGGAPPEHFDTLYAGLDRLGDACQRLADPTGADAAALVELQDRFRAWAEAATPSGGFFPIRVEAEGAIPVATPATPAEAAAPVAPQPAPQGPPPAPPAEETVRVAVRKLDSLTAQIGELLIARGRHASMLAEVRDLQLELDQALRDWKALQDARRERAKAEGRRARALDKQRLALRDRVESRLKSAAHGATSLRRRLTRDAAQLEILTTALQEDIKSARMLPIATILDGFDRLVRDVARRESKRARLVVEGAETEVDKRVLEVLKDPLMHLLRNAVSHGIERPEERERAGKPAVGTVAVRTFRVGARIAVEVSDDGRGFDAARIFERAVELGAADPSRAHSRREALQYVFVAGLSTRDAVTDVSGRGVGLDVVRERIERVHGRVSVDTAPGEGSRVVIALPPTLSTINCLVVEVDAQPFAIPIAAVERVLRVAPSEIRLVAETPAVDVDGAPVGVVRLAEALGVGRAPLAGDERLPVVVLATGDARLACIVDGLVDEQELVVKPLGPQLAGVRVVAGGAITATGDVLLVLDPVDVVRGAAPSLSALRAEVAGGLARGRAEQRRGRVVVAEDSLTTRTLAKSILETAGYEVVACANGAEALAHLRASSCDLLIADVEMPQLDGISLVARVRAIERYRDLPVLLLTSFGTEEDRRRGMEAGASGYIVKSEFDQNRFLELVAAFV